MYTEKTRSYPKIFIASSSESKNVAEHFRLLLNNHADIVCWFDHNVFVNGSTTLLDLIELSKEVDLAIFIFNSDDKLTLRGKDYQVTRDNVVFEYGLFVSQLGPEKTFIVHSKGVPDFHLLTDLAGLTTNSYDSNRPLTQALAETVAKIKTIIERWENEQNKITDQQFGYFERFIQHEEPSLRDGNNIGYTRSFNLLLYMFERESFSEFRALDLAISRWEELVLEDNEQIENVGKEILNEVKLLYREGRCRSFRRILVIPENSIKPVTFEILNQIQHTEQEAKNAVLNQPSNGKSILSTGCDVLETKVLSVKSNEYSRRFKSLNDFALFTDVSGEFAIVETSLLSPSDPPVPYKQRTCKIITNHDENSRRKIAFDSFWEESSSISDFIDKYHTIDESETVLKAFKQFLNTMKSQEAIKRTSVIIETAYVELMKIGDIRRRSHFERAFELLNSFKTNSFLENLKDSIYLDAFINDFKPKYADDYECLEFCDLEGIENSKKFLDLRDQVAKELTNRNRSDIPSDSISTFYMTRTRNAVTDKLKSLRKDPVKKNLIKEEGSGDVKSLFIQSDTGKIYIGYDKGGAIIPNCALLMAEHYYELFQFAYRKNTDHKDFWIFDFLTYSEKTSVGLGAKASFILQTWPKGVTIHIVNCSYFDNGNIGDMRYLGPYSF